MNEKVTIRDKAYALCLAIEEFPASIMQTDISIMASDLLRDISTLSAQLAEKEEQNRKLREGILILEEANMLCSGEDKCEHCKRFYNLIKERR